MSSSVLRTAAALALLIGGALHTRLAFDDYGTQDLITLFLLNGVGSAIVGVWLLYDHRPFAPIAAFGLSAVSLLAFGLSRVGDGVVGFRGVGLEPAPDSILTLGAESLAVLLLAVLLVRSRRELFDIARQLRPAD